MRYLIILLFLSGCANSTYTCQNYKSGRCETVSNVYKKSFNRTSVNEKVSVFKKNYPIENKRNSSVLLSTPRVLRIFLNHWEDLEGDLHVGGYIYLRVKDSIWEI